MTASTTTETKPFSFIVKNTDDQDQPLVYLAIEPDRITELNLSATFDRWGQRVGYEAAGDYHPSNQYTTAWADLKAAIIEKWPSVDPEELSFNDGHLIFELDDLTEYGVIWRDVKKFAADWVEENQILTTVHGFNYFDGSNWQSVIVSSSTPAGEPNFKLITDQNLINELNKSIKDRIHNSDGFGFSRYQCGKWEIIDSFAAGSFENWSLCQIL